MNEKSILVIDDDVDFSKELVERLAAENYKAQTINNSLEAYRELLNHKYDLILLDYKMPGLNGVDLLKLAKKTDPSAKIIIISGRPFIEKILENEAAQGMAAGIISKPFSDIELLKKIEALLK